MKKMWVFFLEVSHFIRERKNRICEFFKKNKSILVKYHLAR